MQKFANDSGLAKNFLENPEITTGHGIGGPIPGRLGTIDQLQLGPDVTFTKVLSRLPTTTSGFFAKSKLGGSIGNEILRRFHVVLDYSENEIRLAHNRFFKEPFKFVPPATLPPVQ